MFVCFECVCIVVVLYRGSSGGSGETRVAIGGIVSTVLFSSSSSIMVRYELVRGF